MIRLSGTFLIGLLIAVSGFTVLAEEAPVTLCTGGPEGNYFSAGRDIAAHANPRYLKVAVTAPTVIWKPAYPSQALRR